VFSAFERMVAMRYLRSRRQEGFISVIAWFSLLGIGLGVATLIIVMSVMNGFRFELLSRILGVNGHLSVYADGQQALPNFDELAKRVQAVPGVVAVTPTVEGQVMASANNQATGVLVRGLRAQDVAKRPILANNIITGNIADFEGTNAILIGDKLARSLNVRVGDQVTLISPKGNVTAFGTVPRMKAYTVVALFSVGMYEYDSRFVYMPLEAAQIYFQVENAVNYLDVMVDHPDNARDRATAIRTATGARNILDWQQSNSSFFTAIQVERNVMFLILTLIIVVAAFNIISSLIMLVKDKGRDIAILRTMGATRGMVMRIFLLSGASVGVIGTMFGFLLGTAFSMNIETIRQWVEKLSGANVFNAEIYFLSKLPAIVDPMEVVIVVGMGLGLSFLATIYPSWRAARLDPVEALRYE
jgi:lipoprotein-releasing system permease protein